ncbi:MAG: FG-GAP-like repeat-containing protein [Thermoplasmata archaeon]
MSDEEMEKTILELSKIPGVGVRFSKRLYDAGYRSAKDLKYATEEDLMKIPGMTKERARTILSGVKEVEKEEIEDEEIERTINEMKKEIAEIEESVERGEDIKFKVVKARAELAPELLSGEEKVEGEAESPVVETPKPQIEPPEMAQKKKPKIITQKSEEQISPQKKKRPVIRREKKRPKMSRRTKAAIAVGVIALLIFFSLFLFYPIFLGNTEPVEIDGNFSDWEDKLFYKMTKDVAMEDVNITRVSTVYTEGNLYFYVEVQGTLFRGGGDGVDALLILIDADAERRTGYLVGDGGADYKVEFLGWDERVVTATFSKYTAFGGNDWNAWVSCGNVMFQVNKGRMEGKVKLQAEEPRCLFYAKHTDNGSVCVFSSDSYVYPQKPSLHIKVRFPGDRVIEKGTSNLLAVLQVTPQGGTATLRNLTLPVNLGKVSLKFTAFGGEIPLPWVLPENQGQSIQLWVQPYEDLPIDILYIDAVSVEADVPVMMNYFNGTFYITKAPDDIQIDGVFQDWEAVEAIHDTDTEKLPDSINILSCKVVPSKSAFFMEVKSDILAGTDVPIGKLVRGTGDGGHSQTRGVDGKDWLKFYIDTSPALNKKNASEGIVNGYLIKIGGICGRITDMEVIRIMNGVQSQTAHRISAANNETAIELTTTFVVPQGSVFYFEAVSWDEKKDVVEPVQPITRYYHEENQGSFSSSFWLIGSGDDIIYDLSTADLNKDGWEDIVTVGNMSSGYEVIIWRNVNGNLQREKGYNQSADVFACDIGDFDWNGWPDIVLGTAYNSGNAFGSREVTIFMNENYHFDRSEIDDFNLERDVNSVSVIDFNHDGYPDILCGTSSSGGGSEVIAFRNDRTGFNFSSENVANPGKKVWCVDTGNLNYDVLGDAVYCTESNSNNEVGIMSFAGIWKPMGIFGDGNEVRAGRIADFNNDGINDIVFATNTIYVALAITSDFAYSLSSYPINHLVYSLTTCDFDSDGFTDIVAGCDDGSIYALENRRNGTFTVKPLGNAGGTKIWDIEAFDYDRDGDSDLVLASDNKNLYILNNTLLHRNFELSLDTCNQLSGSLPIAAAALGDLDLDGDLDIVTAHTQEPSAIIYAWKNPGEQLISPFGEPWERYIVTSDFVQVYALACGDVDNDGYPEIVFSAHSGSNYLLCVATSAHYPWRNNWTWDWESQYNDTVPDPMGKITQISLADMDRDGNIDVLSGDISGNLVVFRRGSDSIVDHNGDWLNETAKIVWNSIFVIETEDIDGDGWMDIVCGSPAGPGYDPGTIWRNLGNPFNQGGWEQYSFDTLDSSITAIALGDFNLDSMPDIACVVNGNQEAKIFINPGNLSNPWIQKEVPGVNIADIAIGDMNNNHASDLVVAFLNGSIGYAEWGSPGWRFWNTGHGPISQLLLANLDRKSTYDGNDLDLIVCSSNSAYLYRNRGANAKIECTQLGPSSVFPGETKALLMLNLTHNGIPEDNHIYFSQLSVQFLNYTTNRIMSPGEMSDLFENISVWLDDGNLQFSQSMDTWIASTSDYGSMYGGFLRISLPKSGNTCVTPLASKTFFICVKLKASIPSNYHNYQFGIAVWCNDSWNYSWHALYDNTTSGIATIVEAQEYLSSQYSLVVGEFEKVLLYLLLVGLNAMHYRKLRRKAF